MTDQTMTPEQALTRAQTLVGKLRGKHVAGSLSLDEQMELGLCWQTLRAALSRPAVPEGYKLVPETMPIGIDDVANLLVMCGDPSSPDEFSDCFLWVGETRDPDGRNSSYGLNVALSEYPEEGSNPFVIFDPPPLAAAPEPAEQHPDDAAVDRFAQAMKAKLAQARAKGRSGWDDPAQCSPEYLADLLAGHVRKGNDGNFVDVANFAMMLHQRGAAPSVMPDAIRRSAAEESLGDASEPVYRLTIRDDRSDVIDACPALLDLDPGHYELHARPESAEGDSE